MGVLELHTWNSRAETPYEHDRLVVDLDPGPRVSWGQVVEAARLVRDVLGELGLRSWPKTTGGRGVHVVVPIAPTETDVCVAFSRVVADAVVDRRPGEFTTKTANKTGRERQILIDVLR